MCPVPVGGQVLGDPCDGFLRAVFKVQKFCLCPVPYCGISGVQQSGDGIVVHVFPLFRLDDDSFTASLCWYTTIASSFYIIYINPVVLFVRVLRKGADCVSDNVFSQQIIGIAFGNLSV